MSIESLQESDVYELTPLADAANELLKIFVYEDGKLELLGEPLLSLEERYARRAQYEGNDRMLELIQAHPEKVRQANEIAEKINKNVVGAQDLLLHKKLANEYTRLMRGKDKKMFDDVE